MSVICEPVSSDVGRASQVAVAAVLPPRSTRVLHLVNGEHYSGAERVQDLLALNLASLGFEVGFACLKPGRFAAIRQARQAPIEQLSMRTRLDFWPVFELTRLVRDHGYALVHTHTPRAVLIGRLAAMLAGVPLVHHLHSPTASDSTRGFQNRVNAWIERNCLVGASAVIAVSESMSRYAQAQGIAAARITVVPNGVPARGPLVGRLPPQRAWTVGTVALFRPRKGLEVLLDSLAVLRSQGLNVRLRAVGEFETAEYQRKIKSQVESLAIRDLVDWVGFTRDVAGELARMDLFVLPSLFGEGLPLVILEAMAAGVPTVATRVEGVPEAVRDGLEGLIAEPNDVADLAHAIARYVRGDVGWTLLREAAHRRHAEHFSDLSMAQGVAKIYKKVLEC